MVPGRQPRTCGYQIRETSEKCTLQAVVLITKGNGYFRGIGLAEVLWKTVPGAINCSIGAAVQFHDVLHGFWVVQGTRTASLEAKLLHKLMEMREEVLYGILLYLQKFYNVIYHE